jgi:hypothetical protein
MAATLYPWFPARDLAKAGKRIRRIGWTDRWISYKHGLWIIEFVDEHGNVTSWRVVLATDFTSAEFLARDWTTDPIGVDTTTPAAAPIILSFTAAPTSVKAGGSAILTWSVQNATALWITGIGSVTGSSRSVTVTQPTLYTLTAANAAGQQVSASVSIGVLSDPTPPTPPPTYPLPPGGPTPPSGPRPGDTPFGGGAGGSGGTGGSGGGSGGSGSGWGTGGSGSGGSSTGSDGGDGGGDGGGGDGGDPWPPPPPPPPPDWQPAQFTVDVYAVCEGDEITIYATLSVSGVAEHDMYQGNLRYGNQAQPIGAVTSDGMVTNATFTASNGFGTHKVYADVVNVGLKYGAKIQPMPEGSISLPPDPSASCCEPQVIHTWITCNPAGCEEPECSPSSVTQINFGDADSPDLDTPGLLGTSPYQRRWRLVIKGGERANGIVLDDGTIEFTNPVYSETYCYDADAQLQIGCVFAQDGTVTWPT